jgi:hypothetical protein
MPPVHFPLVILELGSWELFACSGLKPWSSLFQPPNYLGLQAWATGTQFIQFMSFLFFKSRFHMWQKICKTCLSEPGLFHLTWWKYARLVFLNLAYFIWRDEFNGQGTPIFLQKLSFHFSLWIMESFIYIIIFFVCSWVDGSLGWFHSLAVEISAR